MRNLTKTLAVISLLAPSSGYSLGIGDIKLHSALNQNLNAEIALVLSAGENASDIKVNLAPPDKFDEAGVAWAPFLPKIKFATVAGANGLVVIKLSSSEAVKEPFLDFLLEVSWPKGSLYREFTVLVDPPEIYKQATVPVVTSPENYLPEQDVTPQRKTLESPQAEAENSADGGEYGPTRRNDTLWKIAERADRKEGVSVEQMMIAIYEENPRAFYQENMNALLVGKTLKIPDREVALKLSRKQALAELNRQTIAWKNNLTQSPVKTADAKKDAVEKQLTLLAPTEAPISENVNVAPEKEQVATKKTAADEFPAPSETAGKEAGVTSPVDNALQDKVAELEKQLATMQQIIALKDQQLAALQNQSQAKPVTQPQVIQTPPGKAEITATVAPQKPAQPVDKPPAQPEAEAFLDPYYLWVGGIGIGTLSLLGWVWWRKRKFDEETDIQAPFVASTLGNIYESKGGVSPSLNNAAYDANVAGAGESSFLSEITFADFDTFDTDQNEIDPVSEADVYLAYGRYQQAEELMRDTLKDQPDRDECKLKLLEIFYSRENKPAFEAYAGELAETGKKDDIEFWAKVTQMGSEICPDSKLFSSGANQFSAEKHEIFEKSLANIADPDRIKTGPVTEIKKMDFGLAAFNKSFHDEAVKEGTEAAGGLFNFDLTSLEDDVLDDEMKNNESIDFDSDKLTDITEFNEAHEDFLWEPQEEDAGKNEFESLDFDLSSNAVIEKENGKIDLSAVADVDDGYQSIDFLTDKPADLSDSISNDPLEGDFEFEFDMPGAGYGQASELTDMDELETKLDLAMAYIDMNDSDAAKDIAKEVLEKGTPEQQMTAQALLDRLE